MAEHRAEQVFDVIGVQPSLRGLGAAGGDQILLACRVKGGQLVLLFDFGDLLDTGARWASSSTSCLSMRSICSRSWSSWALWGRRLGGAGGGARAWCWGLLTHG